MSQNSYNKPTKSQQNYPLQQNWTQSSSYGYQQLTSNQYNRNYNNSYSQAQYNQYRGGYPDQYQEQYYQQGYQNYEYPNYYQSYYQQHPKERQYYQNNPQDMNQSYYQKQYAYQQQVQMQEAKKKSMTPSNVQQKNLSQSQAQNKNQNQPNSLSRNVAYQPGQQTTTHAQLPKDVGLPNWQNPYKESRVWLEQSSDSSFRYQQPQRPKGYREKHESEMNNSFADFENKFTYDDDFFNQDSVRPQERGIQEVGRFGGAKKKKKRQNADQSITSIQSIPAKKKEKSLAEQSNSMGYFTIETVYVKTVSCPFDPSHIMQPDRLLTHISRCKEKCGNAHQYVMCPYDPTHYYRFDQIEAHKNACDKKAQLVMQDFWNLQVDNLNQSTRPNISASFISNSNNKESQTLPPAAEPTHQVVEEDPERTKFENILITDF